VINATAHHASFAVRRAAVPLFVKDGSRVLQLPDSDYEGSFRIRFARYNCYGMTVTGTVLMSGSPGSATGIHDHGVAARRLLLVSRSAVRTYHQHSFLLAKDQQQQMEGTAPDPACLIVGAPAVGKFTLIRALQLSPELKAPSPADYTVRLDTKYYTADVAVRALTTQQQDKQKQLHADAWEQLQALVLVFDASSEASFTSVRSWAETRDTDSIEVKLLVANKVDRLQQQSLTASSTAAGAAAACRTQWLQDVMSWCVDQGFEYIEAAAGNPAVDAALQLDGEPQGVARVLAALQAHMWPGLVQKDWQPRSQPDIKSAGSKAAAAAAAAGIDAGAGVGGSSCSSSSCKDQGTPAAVAAAADAVAGSTGSAANAPLPAQQPLERQTDKGDQPQDSSVLKCSQPVQEQLEDRQLQQQHQQAAAIAADDDDEAGFDVDDLEQMMKQLQGEIPTQHTYMMPAGDGHASLPSAENMSAAMHLLVRVGCSS
jgi:hypothetical protein